MKLIKEHIIGILVISGIVVIILLSSILANDMEEHIERVSKECASQGYGIKATYTKERDKFYICDKDGDIND